MGVTREGQTRAENQDLSLHMCMQNRIIADITLAVSVSLCFGRPSVCVCVCEGVATEALTCNCGYF